MFIQVLGWLMLFSLSLTHVFTFGGLGREGGGGEKGEK